MTSPTTTTAYRVETFQEGEWWVARVAWLDANYTQARTLEEVREMARDLILHSISTKPMSARSWSPRRLALTSDSLKARTLGNWPGTMRTPGCVEVSLHTLLHG